MIAAIAGALAAVMVLPVVAIIAVCLLLLPFAMLGDLFGPQAEENARALREQERARSAAEQARRAKASKTP
jgi:hypothetical protein